MKPKNFPARKMRRQLRAKGIIDVTDDHRGYLEGARRERTKKDRRK